MLVKYNVMQNQTQIINWLIENVGKYNCGCKNILYIIFFWIDLR